MCKKKSGNSSSCPDCAQVSTSVHSYQPRVVSHYAIGGMEQITLNVIIFRCLNTSCSRKSFSVVMPNDNLPAVVARGRYTESSKTYIANRLLKRSQSYNSVRNEIREDFGGKTSLSTLHTWVQHTKLEDVPKDFDQMQVLHTDEKHPSKKKEKQTINLL
jgi:transposase